MIDWVSIVRHSRRRFSNYMYAVPSKVRKRRRTRKKKCENSVEVHSRYRGEDGGSSVGSSGDLGSHSMCSCCWNEDNVYHGDRYDQTRLGRRNVQQVGLKE